MNALDEFTKLYMAWDDAKSRKWDRAKRYDAWARGHGERLFRRLFPKRKKYRYEAIKDRPEWAAIGDRFKGINERWGKHWESVLNPMEERLYELAQAVSPPKSDDWFHCDTKNSGNWGSVGFGAIHYAEAAALSVVDQIQSCDIEAETRTTNPRSYDHGISHADIEVWAKTTLIGWEIIRRRPALPLVERVRLCWKRGANPRVDMWWLPVGYEEQNGLDYFGHYVKPREGVAAA